MSRLAESLTSLMSTPFPAAIAHINGLTSLSFNPQPVRDSNSRLPQGIVGKNVSADNPRMLLKESVPESLIPSKVKADICKESGDPKAMNLERSTKLGGVILHFFSNKVFKFLSSGSFSMSTAIPSALFNEKSNVDK